MVRSCCCCARRCTAAGIRRFQRASCSRWSLTTDQHPVPAANHAVLPPLVTESEARLEPVVPDVNRLGVEVREIAGCVRLWRLRNKLRIPPQAGRDLQLRRDLEAVLRKERQVLVPEVVRANVRDGVIDLSKGPVVASR